MTSHMAGLNPQAIISSTAALAGLAAYVDGRYGFSRDIKQYWSDKRFGQRLQGRIKTLGSVASLYGHLSRADPNAEALWFENRQWTYAEVLQRADSLAEILAGHGIGPGSFVAVFMTNSPEMVFAMVAISKLGGVAGLVNTALRSDTLLHCLGVANASTIVVTPDLAEHLVAVKDEPKMAKACFVFNVGSFDQTAPPPALQEHPDQFFPVSLADLNAVSTSRQPAPRTLKDIGVLIYTSGTSGKPKAVSIKNFQFALVSTPLSVDVDNPNRYLRPLRIFSCLPLFHATCMFTGLLYASGSSGTFCLARKFSASGFSRSLVESGATRFLYVGELCRYLLKAPPSPYDRAHSCRIGSGNGLQKDVWLKFMDRFGIEEIREFYRSTEGIAKFDNFSRGTTGAGKIGYQGPIARFFNTHTYLVKYDPETEEPWRDPKTGFCAIAKPGEPGEAIGRVANLDFYNNYLNNPEADQKKLVANVFKKGDLFQRMGDLLVQEKSGWVHFLDRTGDTYRWNGENVSAGEVREHISRLSGVQDVTVYAVKLEGYDGQAGAAAITLADHNVPNENKFAASLYESLKRTGLTTYQMPRLIRFVEQIDVNATFKHAKTVMQTRSWDPLTQLPGDRVFWLNGDTYRALDSQAWSEIQAGKARL